MSDVPVFSRERLDELEALGTMAGVPLVANLLTSFLESLPEQVQSIHDAVATGDAVAQKFVSHSLKSSCAQLGALALAGVLQSLEHASSEAARSLVVDLDREVASVTPILEAELKAAQGRPFAD